MLSTCVGVTSSLTAAEVAMLTNAWAELLTPASVNDDTVRYCIHSILCIIRIMGYSELAEGNLQRLDVEFL